MFALAVLVGALSAAKSSAETVTLTIQPAQSSLSLSGNAFGLVYTPQVPGGLDATWSGTITGDLTGGVFTFSGGSAITAEVNPVGPFETAPNVIGTIAGNYGVNGTGLVFPFGNVTIKGVYRNLAFDISSGTAQNGAAMAGSNFVLTSGELVWGAISQLGQTADDEEELVSVSGSNSSASNVTWDGTTLTLPVSVQTTGSNRVENWTGTIVATLVSPPPTLVNARVSHTGYSGQGSPVNESVQLIQRSNAAQQVQLTNLINSSRGINGMVLDLDGLTDLNDATLEYKMSPQGAFNEGDNPVAGWVDAPAPTSVSLLPGQGLSGSNRIALVWADNAIANRYVCVSLTVGGTRIFEVYVGHLLGETTGPSNNSFTVAFADITPIRSAVGSAVDSSSPTDIDKNGTVSFADISAMRGNVGAQLTQITIPANP
jgi:hypothetical protein